jgi:hypothetical protein
MLRILVFLSASKSQTMIIISPQKNSEVDEVGRFSQLSTFIQLFDNLFFCPCKLKITAYFEIFLL